ncbi:hypothetical protein [Streptomyces sp. NPDC058964]|uniref:hypothetical protein n=1 Tax=Streptomyces sp. NPDC058964 TaxID=3346681 RepID=UPI003693526D
MDQRREELPDQIVFRWAGNRGRDGTGVTAVAYSCGKERAEELRDELATLLVVEGSDWPSQVRHIREKTGEVVVINRRRGSDAHGRGSTESHALIGSAGLLKARLCLTLSGLAVPVPMGGLFESDSRRLRRATHTELREAADREWARFAARVAAVRAPLSVVAAQLLRTPDHLMSVRVPEFSAAGTNDTPLLIWGLCGIFGDWLGQDFWTYATYDTSDSHGLRVVGVPDWRRSATGDARVERIALRSAPEDEAQQIAAELVRRFLAEPNKAGEVRRVLGRCPRAAELPLPQRLHTLRQLLEATLLPAAEPMGPAAVRPVPAVDPTPGNSLLGGAGEPEPDGGPGRGQEEPGTDRLRAHPAGPSPASTTGVPVHEPPSSSPAQAPAQSTDDERAVRGGSAEQHSVPRSAPAPMAPSPTAFIAPDGTEPASGAPPAPPSSLRPQPENHFQHPQHRTPWTTSWQQSGHRAQWPLVPPIRHATARSHPRDHFLPQHRPQGGDGFPDRGPYRQAGPGRPLPPPLTRGRSLLRRLTLARRRHNRQTNGNDLSRLPDEVLLSKLRAKGITRQGVERILDALADRTPWRTRREAILVCRGVLKARLYLQRGQDPRHGETDGQGEWHPAETAVWLFHWAVSPYTGHRRVGDDVRALFRDIRKRADPMEHRFLELLVRDSDYGVPDLPSQAWLELVHHLRNEPGAPARETRDEPPARPLDRHAAPAAAHRAEPPPDDRWRIGFAVMSCVAVLLFLLLIA